MSKGNAEDWSYGDFLQAQEELSIADSHPFREEADAEKLAEKLRKEHQGAAVKVVKSGPRNNPVWVVKVKK